MPGCERKERAVSELIGAILLVGLVVTAMAIVAVVLLSNPPPEEVPQLSVLASKNDTSKLIFLYHNGGDGMRQENTIIRINENPTRVSNEFIKLQYENGTRINNWSRSNIPWTLGKTLIVPSDKVPQKITVSYQGPTSQNLILTTTFTAGS